MATSMQASIPGNWLTADPALLKETQQQVGVTEASAAFARPLLRTSGSGFEIPQARFWQRRLALAGADIRKAARATGSIENQGSGWLVNETVLLTAQSTAARLPDSGMAALVRFDNGATARVRQVRTTPEAPEFAFLVLEPNDGLPEPMHLLEGFPAYPYIAVIGDRADIPDQRCLAPGRLTGSTPSALMHDCGTLGNMGGSVVLDLDSGKAAGVHLTGGLSDPGLALSSSRIFEALRILGIQPAQMLESADEDPDFFEAVKATAADYDDRIGYQEDFIGVPVPLPGVPDPTDLLEYKNTKGKKTHVLPYTHFSVALSKSRKLCWFTAVNIKGSESIAIKRGKDKWSFDPRIGKVDQAGPELYTGNDLDLGHMVRRMDPDWGSDAETADLDTFHFTNACPQHKDLNRKIWNDLEDYVLKNTTKHQLEVCLFTGPVFSDDDPAYRGFRLPLQFWKVVSILNDDGQLSATAYILSQADMITGLEFAFGEFRTYQLPITELETITGLDFGELRDFDPKGKLEAAVTVTEVTGPEDVVV